MAAVVHHLFAISDYEGPRMTKGADAAASAPFIMFSV